MVQKVRALVEGGTVAGVYSSAFSNVPISGVTQSAKATQLLPPSGPSLVSPWGCGSRFGVGLIYLLGGIFAFLGFLALFYLIAGIGKFSEYYGAFYCFPIAAFFFAIAIAITIRKQKAATRLKAKYAIDRARWEHARDTWNELYYCARDDVVFLPNQAGKCVPASQMSALLGWP